MQCNTYDKGGKIIPKVPFETRGEAKKAARRMKREHKELKGILMAYKCKLCGKFHIGKDFPWIRKQLKKRK